MSNKKYDQNPTLSALDKIDWVDMMNNCDGDMNLADLTPPSSAQYLEEGIFIPKKEFVKILENVEIGTPLYDIMKNIISTSFFTLLAQPPAKELEFLSILEGKNKRFITKKG